jgi:hypothetical protein
LPSPPLGSVDRYLGHGYGCHLRQGLFLHRRIDRFGIAGLDQSEREVTVDGDNIAGPRAGGRGSDRDGPNRHGVRLAAATCPQIFAFQWLPGANSIASLWGLRHCIVAANIPIGVFDEHLSSIFVGNDGGVDTEPFGIGPDPFETS